MIELPVKILRSYKEKMIGLIGQSQRYPVYFTTRWGIHTFGLKFPIDVVILNNKNIVVRLVHNLSPNRIYFWLPIYKGVIELPAGEILKNDITIGEQVNLVSITQIV